MFTDSKIHVEVFEVLLFASPEERCLYSLNTLLKTGQLKTGWIADFKDYEMEQPIDLSSNDKNTTKHYYENLSKMRNKLESVTTNINVRSFKLNHIEPFDNSLGNPSPFNLPIIVDISCTPRGHLLALLDYLARCQVFNKQRIILAYSLVKQQSAIEDNYSYGMQEVAVVPGYSGKIRLKQDLLIMVVGFEGNRAYSLYRKLSPNKTFLILGDSENEADRDFYIKGAKINNSSLLRIPGIQDRMMPSRDPLAFSEKFDEFLRDEIEPIKDKYNVYFSCLGTKLQTIGAFFILKKHSYIQVLDALPTRRRIASEGELKTVFEDFGTNKLADFVK